ncbi:hypothetical protein [uncultured phage MedDCM-OCT-S09-C299]|nr:hypothetical protein [uncultured phage MedDCM-OCT-S09-C299]
MSTLKVNNIKDTSGGTSNLKIDGAAKAWVNFNGTGTVAIRDDLNVSSITDNGTGDYTVNFTNALANANYCFQLSATDDGTGADMTDGFAYGAWKRGSNSTAFSTSSARFQIGYAGSGVLYDVTDIMATVFGD